MSNFVFVYRAKPNSNLKICKIKPSSNIYYKFFSDFCQQFGLFCIGDFGLRNEIVC